MGVSAVGCAIIVLGDKRAVGAVKCQVWIEIVDRLAGAVPRRIGLDREYIAGLHGHLAIGDMPSGSPDYRLLQKLIGRS